MYIFLLSFSTCMVATSRYCYIFFKKMMLMVQTSEYIEDSHHQYELASLVMNVDVHVFILFAKLFIAINNHF